MNNLDYECGITNNIEEDLKMENSQKKIKITEKDVFGAGVGVGIGVVAYEVAKEVFPKIVEKVLDFVNQKLEK